MRALSKSPDTPVDHSTSESGRSFVRFLRNPFVRLVAFIAFSLLAGTLAALLTVGLSEQAQIVIVPLASAIIGYLLTCWVCEGRPIPYELHPERAYQLWYGLVVGAALLLVSLGLVALLGSVSISKTTGIDWKLWWQILASSVLVAGIAEELITRGIVFRFLEALTGTWIAVALSGLLFGAMHLPNPNATWWSALSIALTAGVFLGLVYALTRSLWWVIGIHAAWNGMQGIVLGIPVSGIEVPGLYSTEISGSEMITGGAFGIEASGLTVIVYAVASTWVGWLVWRKDMAFAPFWRKTAAANTKAISTTGESVTATDSTTSAPATENAVDSGKAPASAVDIAKADTESALTTASTKDSDATEAPDVTEANDATNAAESTPAAAPDSATRKPVED